MMHLAYPKVAQPEPGRGLYGLKSAFVERGPTGEVSLTQYFFTLLLVWNIKILRNFAWYLVWFGFMAHQSP